MRYLAVPFIALVFSPAAALAEDTGDQQPSLQISEALPESSIPEDTTRKIPLSQPTPTTTLVQPNINEHPTADTLIPDKLRELVNRTSPPS